MKFREKTYLVTLVLFLVILNAGIFSLAFYTYKSNVDAAENLCLAEEQVIVEALSNDLAYLKEGASEQLVLLSYGAFYRDKGIRISVWKGEENLLSTLPSGISAPQAGNSKTQRLEDKRYFLISEEIDDGAYLFTYAKDISYLDTDFKNLALLYIPTSVLASAFLALCLFFVLRKLAFPLEKLRAATEEIASGNFSVRADENGKDEFSQLAGDFNRMAEHIDAQMKRLEESAEIKQRMLDNLAHEMRTPLTSIRGYAEFLQSANIPESEKWEVAEYIISEAERLKQIGERLLDEAFIRENGIKKEEVNLALLLRDTAKPLALKASRAGVELKTELQDLCISCDPLLIGMLVTNLTDNAVKACRTRENGTVTIGCSALENGKRCLFVRDNGIGMTEDQLSRITEPFYRTDKSRSRDEGGTGLGLSLCDRIVKSHGWTMLFESSVGKGTEATVIL